MMMKGKKRPHIVQTTFNDAELAALKTQADLEGLSVTAFIRQLVIKNCPVVTWRQPAPVKNGHEES
jgi:hypothetical protein